MFKVIQENNIITAFISGSFDALAQKASMDLGGVNHIYAHCKLEFDQEGLLNK